MFKDLFEIMFRDVREDAETIRAYHKAKGNDYTLEQCEDMIMKGTEKHEMFNYENSVDKRISDFNRGKK